MKNTQIILLIISIILISTIYLIHNRKKRIRKLDEEWLFQMQLDVLRNLYEGSFRFYNSKVKFLEEAIDKYKNLTNEEKGYLSNYEMNNWKSAYSQLYEETKNTTHRNCLVDLHIINLLEIFFDKYENFTKLRTAYNRLFVENELIRFQEFFNNIGGKSLDLQQRESIIQEDDNNLIIAGAGSGKTTTIVGKVNYILTKHNVNPKDILLISYTNKSAEDLYKRLNIKDVEIKTFHKLGKDILTQHTNKKPNIFDENQFKQIILRSFINNLKNDFYISLVTEYFTKFLKPPKSQFEFDNQGEYIQYLKDYDFKTYKTIPTDDRRTFKREIVKSIEECKIANFLLFNGVHYEYEYPYEFDTATETYRQYKPDFTIIQNGKKVYIEHFGINQYGNVPSFFINEGESQEIADKKYNDKIKWARELHRFNKTHLIETYSYEMKDETLFVNLKNNLESIGIILVPKSANEIWKIISNTAEEEVKVFISLFGTFINLMKSNNFTLDDIKKINMKTKDSFHKKRNEIFIDIINPIISDYNKHLRERGEIDFSDMINEAKEIIDSGKHLVKYKYIIIDEFQDISIGRYQIIKSLKLQNPSCKLFCVGDDWQSIYRFSGSDISLFKDFDKYFGYTIKSKIETTYRFNEPLIRLSSDFILKNPNQSIKKLKGIENRGNTNYKFIYSNKTSQDDTQALYDILDSLANSIVNISKKEVYVLGRYKHDLKRIKNENNIFEIDFEEETIKCSCTNFIEEKNINFDIKYMTVHKSKGLEADIVIILNCNSGKYGFPSEMSDDQILNLLLSESDQYENGEERRLFYVAMTRAKEEVYFISDSYNKSKFIAELEIENLTKSDNKKCPICKSTDIVIKKKGIAKNGNNYTFWGCSNYNYGCKYTKTEFENN